jgi:hypothetical protein
MAISQPPFQSTLVDADDRVQTPWAQWFSQLQPILQSVVASGPTSGRPTQNLYIGYPYFDTTIDQMVYWNGVIWVTYAPSTTGTSILKGNGSGGFNNAVAGVDFAPATSGSAILYGNGGGGFSSVSIGSGVTFAGGVLSALGSGGTVTSVSGTGSVNGITLTGTVTSSGSLTLGGTLGGIGNSQLTNSSITINGSTVSLGGSTTVTATATNALTIGTGLSGTSYDGSTAVTIANTGVLSITGTALQITASASTGAVTLSLPSSVNVNTTGYAAGLAGGGANYVPYQTAVNTTGFVSPGVVGQVFTSTGSGSAPNWQNATSPPGSPGYYGAWHDTSTVTATSTTTAYVMNIGSIDLENGTSIVGGTKLTVANTGVYNLQFSAQLSNPNSQIADVSIWIRLNGVNVTDGAGTNGVPAKHGSNNGLQIISWNYVLNLTAGDYIELVWHSDTTGVQLITFPATTSPAVPESPSLIVTIQTVTQIGIGYQGLTSATSVLIATGSKVFTTNFTNSQTAFAIGTRVRVAYSSTPADFMEGVVTAFSGTTFTVLVDSIGGSGTFASWTISVAGIQGSNGVTSFSGNSTGLTPATATTGAISLAGILVGANGGTGVANTGKTFTIGGNFTTSGAFTTSLTVTANTALTLPISGTVISSVTAPAANPITGTPSASNYLRGDGTWATFTTGTVTSVGFTGGLITVATPTTTPAFTVAGTSGGIPYFSSTSTWASSAALALNSLVIGGGAGLAPATTTTGTGVLTALGTNVGSAGAFVTFNGALGTPSSGTVTNLTGTASININGSVGATTANTGKFTTLEYSSTLTGGTGILNIGSGQVYKDASGNVGIGTSSPSAKLHVGSSSSLSILAQHPGNNSFGTVIQATTTGGTDDPMISLENYNAGSPVRYGISCTDNGSLTFKSGGYAGAFGDERMRISSTGIVTMSAYGAGAATFSAAGVISSVSDETWKIKDGVPVDADSMLKNLEPGYWFYNEEKAPIFGTDRQLGFYAQNVNAAIGPEAAPTPEEGKPWGYYDRSVLAVAVMSLQKALTTIEEQQTLIVQLQADVVALKTKVGA